MQRFQTFLISELKKRQQSNPLFSLRAFARTLQISPSHLSHLINGKRNLTRRQSAKISSRLGLSTTEARRFLDSSIEPSSRVSPKMAKRILKEDEFSLISNWYHFAILSMGKLSDNKASAKWIADRLGISTAQALEAFDRLKRLDLIEIKNGHFRQKNEELTTTTEVPSSVIRHHHKQNLVLAQTKLETIPVELREFSSITMAIHPGKLKKIKKQILNFKEQIASEFEKGELTEVYTLAIQLFPVTNPRRNP